jgi:hypothetical protein
MALHPATRLRTRLATSHLHTPGRTVLWLAAVKLLEGFGKPMTYSYQRVLPSLPGAHSRATPACVGGLLTVRGLRTQCRA